MLQPIFDFIEKLASDFSWRKIVIVLCLASTGIFLWFVYESQTATYQLDKYERTVVILEKLESLALSDSKSQKVAENLYQGLDSITKINKRKLSYVSELSLEASQAILSVVPWFLFILFYLAGALRGDNDSRNSIFALVFIGLFIGGIGYFVPPTLGLWIYPIGGNFLALVIIAFLGSRMKSKK